MEHKEELLAPGIQSHCAKPIVDYLSRSYHPYHLEIVSFTYYSHQTKVSQGYSKMADMMRISSILNAAPDSEDTRQLPATTPSAAEIFASGPITYLGCTFVPEDFHPRTVWLQTKPHPSHYRECPPADIIPDELLFHADPKMLAYGNLIRLARHYSNFEIWAFANAGRETPVFNSDTTVAVRLKAACKWMAEKMNDPERMPRATSVVLPTEILERLRDERARNGVNICTAWPEERAEYMQASAGAQSGPWGS
ncbi:hypothetical protein LTS02_009266 [Friedmanniomyces endolithicus]|nr:hypothetical protein LTR94_023301 [Friedmanniomyces endolithicus]KAK0768160.1 hypothetical protein LTR59_017878 [Friedmanniomyces endolithicus]KAK0859374.1 hypothetical protein LTS02_009266 [Friedmanniomyces endolithicus]